MNTLVGKFPRPLDFNRVIDFLNAIAVSPTMRRRYYGQWAKMVGHQPTTAEFERAAGTDTRAVKEQP